MSGTDVSVTGLLPAMSFGEPCLAMAEAPDGVMIENLEFALDLDRTGITVFDAGGRLTYANRAFLSLYGLSGVGNIRGQSVLEVAARVRPASMTASSAQNCLAPAGWQEEQMGEQHYDIPLASGGIVHVSHHACSDGGWVSRHVPAANVFPVSQSVDELIPLQTLIDQLPDYLWIKDASSRFLVANLALARDSGREKSSDIIGLTDFDLHEHGKASQFYAKERGILLNGTPMLDEEECIVDAAGREKWLSSSKIPLRSTQGEIVGLIGVARDITARKKAEELRQRAFELEESARGLAAALEKERHLNAMQRQFVSMASHEFRTPLAIIDGAAQRLVRRRDELSPDFVGEKSQQIRQAVSRMVELMESILSFGKLEAGAIAITPVPVSLRELLSTCCRRQESLSKGHRIVMETDALPDKIMADRSAIEQVFTNLLSNAVKYSLQPSSIVVRGWCEDNEVRVTVKDHGIGIDADDLPRMFERYFRARTSTGIAGTGIGLNLVKQLIELHGGRISVESKRGEGSEFTISLPLGAVE
ncbi:sensor histidine kinase [Ciceribacter ferrooxidans]|nr:PAS domain-containing sensor histidine kinase [Ciceribacter ferrooxidans]